MPKAGNKTRLIFHLSYQFEQGSVNSNIPSKWCSVKYNDLDHAVRNSIKLVGEDNKVLYFSKTDLSSAFRMVPGHPGSFKWMMLQAPDPETGERFYFIDKCLPFGASISCSHFQRFSNALNHVFEHLTGIHGQTTNYLDDFLFVSTSEEECNEMVRRFTAICNYLGVPIATEKTEWASTRCVFLGIMMDGGHHVLSIPEEKRTRAVNLLTRTIAKRKSTVKELQKLSGYLNFLTKAIFPGCTFTRRMYAKFQLAALKLKPHHHITLDEEFKSDAEVWLKFLELDSGSVVCRPWVDLDKFNSSTELNFWTDASGAKDGTGGLGCLFNNHWIAAKWDVEFLKEKNPSIEFLELHALTTGLLAWASKLKNSRIIVFCDNQAVVGMVNKLSSGCKQCMNLLRLIVLNGLKNNFRVFTKYISTSDNFLSDALSRGKIAKFHRKAKEIGLQVNLVPDGIPEELWPIEKVWS